MDIFENMSLIAITGSSRTMFKCLITTFQKGRIEGLRTGSKERINKQISRGGHTQQLSRHSDTVLH